MEMKSYSVKDLIEDKVMRGKVINMMQTKQSYDFIISYLASNGIKMAKGSLTNFKNKIKESESTGIALEHLGDKREKNSIKQVDTKKIVGFAPKIYETNKPKEGTAQFDYANTLVTKRGYVSNADALEQIISKGLSAIDNMDIVEPTLMLKSIELYQKYFASDKRGLSQEALKQYQIIMQARMTAITQVIMQYVPDNKQEEAINEMEKSEQEVLKQLGANKETQALMQELKKAGLE